METVRFETLETDFRYLQGGNTHSPVPGLQHKWYQETQNNSCLLTEHSKLAEPSCWEPG